MVWKQMLCIESLRTPTKKFTFDNDGPPDMVDKGMTSLYGFHSDHNSCHLPQYITVLWASDNETMVDSPLLGTYGTIYDTIEC